MKTETVLIKHLRNNSRRSLSEISRETGLPTSSLFDKLRRMEQGIFLRHVSLIDFHRIGFGLKAELLVKAKEKQRDALRKFLMESHSVNSAFRTNNGMDFFAEAIFKGMREFEVFCEKLESLKAKTRVHFVIDEMKREDFLTKEDDF